jgi:hypothetical protein
MDEEKKAQRDFEKKANEGQDDGNKPEAKSIVEQANEAAERLRAENDRAEKINQEAKELKAFEKLGGKSQGGAPENQPKEEMTEDKIKEDLGKAGW